MRAIAWSFVTTWALTGALATVFVLAGRTLCERLGVSRPDEPTSWTTGQAFFVGLALHLTVFRVLATGVGVGMRLWRDRPPGEAKPPTARDYETVGYVISGRAELHSEGQMVLLEPGNCWVVPRHAMHTYKILEPFTAIEATHPPAEIHDRDHPAGQ